MLRYGTLFVTAAVVALSVLSLPSNAQILNCNDVSLPGIYIPSTINCVCTGGDVFTVDCTGPNPGQVCQQQCQASDAKLATALNSGSVVTLGGSCLFSIIMAFHVIKYILVEAY